MIADTMAARPRVNLTATYFRDSYKCEAEFLDQKFELVRELLDF